MVSFLFSFTLVRSLLGGIWYLHDKGDPDSKLVWSRSRIPFYARVYETERYPY